MESRVTPIRFSSENMLAKTGRWVTTRRFCLPHLPSRLAVGNKEESTVMTRELSISKNIEHFVVRKTGMNLVRAWDKAVWEGDDWTLARYDIPNG